jgi:hypothetical protein
MLFLRAKRALQRELSRNGFGKASLLTALVVFGKMTAPTKAAAAKISVTAAATKVGLLAEAVVLATSKTAVVSVAAAGAITAGTIVAPSILPRHEMSPSEAVTPVVVQFGINSEAREQHWQYFPDGPSGAMILRAESGPAGDNMYEREILQNEYANYDYHGNTVHINNHRMWAADLSVPTLPTDDPKMVDFLSRVVPGTKAAGRVRKEGNSLLVAYTRENGENKPPSAVYDRTALQEHFFQPDWLTTAGEIDSRDEMHRRGWTYFRIRGHLNGRNVMGSGRIPFVYATSREKSPWIKLRVGNISIVDTYGQASLLEDSSDEPSVYRGGSFFKGLARPWMGMHTIDTVRRDAAEQRIWFETRYLEDDRFAEVEMDCEGVNVVYKIDMMTDVIDEITFTSNEGEVGNLKFSYLQSIEGADRIKEFDSPDIPRRRTSPKANPGMLWLVHLVGD